MIVLNVFSNHHWISILVLNRSSDSKGFYVLRTLKLWLKKEKKATKNLLLYFSWFEKSSWRQWPSCKRKDNFLTVWGPWAMSLRAHTWNEDNTRSHNWSTFIHIKGWESLRLLTVQCFYSSHLPYTHCFQISPNWITESRPNDLSCPSTIYHTLFYMNFIIRGKYSLTPFSIF